MRFQRQGCILSNGYKELSITETSSLYILLGSCPVSVFLNMKSSYPLAEYGHVICRVSEGRLVHVWLGGIKAAARVRS